MSTIPSPENATIADVTHWVGKMAERGIYNSSQATNAISAIGRMESILDTDEPRTARYVLDNLDQLADRWAVKNQGNPTTATTYRARARTAFQDFFNYLESPTGFQPKARARDKEDGSRSRAPKARAAPSAPKPTDAPSSPRPTPNIREYPLGADREPFRYILPADMKMRDVRRIAFHLLTMASDFEAADALAALTRGDAE